MPFSMKSKVNNRVSYHRGNFTQAVGNPFHWSADLGNLLIVDRSAIGEDMFTMEKCLFGKALAVCQLAGVVRRNEDHSYYMIYAEWDMTGPDWADSKSHVAVTNCRADMYDM